MSELKIYCGGDGLKLAIEDAFKQMEGDDADGFDYEIGQIKGHPIRIVWEDESKNTKEIIVMSGLTFEAVTEVGS